jgi:hypothetical protein
VLLSREKKHKEHAVQSFMLRLINTSCAELRAQEDGPRVENRVNLMIVVQVIPVIQKQPAVERMFAAVTRELTTLGLSLVLNEPRSVDEVILAFRTEGEMKFVRAKAKHVSPMGAGFYSLGMRFLEMAHPSDYPALQSVYL